MGRRNGTKARACDGKRRNPDRAAALAQLARMVKQRGAAPDAFEAYRCRRCGAWHIGHRSRGRR